ncbi:MAG: hypothetical protein KAV00_05250 [Phycisphaerae bacterium]|nr:hypothetical protein [Phycisphaerae bacterium]
MRCQVGQGQCSLTMKMNVVVRQWQIVDVPSRSGPADVARLTSVRPANRQPRRCRRVMIGQDYATARA